MRMLYVRIEFDRMCNVRVRSIAKMEPTTNVRWSSLVQSVAGVRFLLNNIFIVNGHQIRKQIVGIPMGTNCSPVLANLFLYYYESRYIDSLLANAKTHTHARAFHLSFRYIDDTLAVDNPFWAHAVSQSIENGGMYPSELTLNDTTPPLLSDNDDSRAVVHFLGMDIHSVGNRFRIAVFDKRDEFSFPVRRYPQMKSLLPSTIPYGVFLGQLHRGYRICSGADDFVNFACDVALRLVVNGCRKARLQQLFVSFIKRFVSKYHAVKLTHMVRSFRYRV